MSDESGAYDRMVEGVLERHERRHDKTDERLMKLELWRNTVLVAFATLMFIAGAASRDLAGLIKHLWP